MRNFKQWTGAERQASLKKFNEAIRAGEFPAKPDKCCKCNQTQGIMQWHNTDYSHPTKFCIGLCWRCHMMLHSEHLNGPAVRDYFIQCAAGKMWAAIFKQDFSILRRDHNIPDPRTRRQANV